MPGDIPSNLHAGPYLFLAKSLHGLSPGSLTRADEEMRKGQTHSHRKDGIGWSGPSDRKAQTSLKLPVFIVYS